MPQEASRGQSPCQGCPGALPPPHLESLVEGTFFQGMWVGLGRHSLCPRDGDLDPAADVGRCPGAWGQASGPSELTLQTAAVCWHLARTRLCLLCWVGPAAWDTALPALRLLWSFWDRGLGGEGQVRRGQDPPGLLSQKVPAWISSCWKLEALGRARDSLWASAVRLLPSELAAAAMGSRGGWAAGKGLCLRRRWALVSATS